MKRLTILLAALGAMLLVSAAPALASGLTFKEVFGSAHQPTFGAPYGLAVDQSTEDLFVIDQAAGTLSRWHADGTPANFTCAPGPKCTVSGNAITGLSFNAPIETEVAVDSSGTATNGNIYLSQGSGANAIDVFGQSGELKGQLTGYRETLPAGPTTPYGYVCGVAVDPSGNVYVGDAEGGADPGVHKYAPSGSVPVNGDNTLNIAASEPCNLAADAGSIYATTYLGKITKFNSATGLEDYVVSSNPTLTASVDPANGHLFVAHGTEITEYNVSGPGEATEVSSLPLANRIYGIAVNGSTGDLYASSEGNTQVEVFGQSSGPTNRRALTLTKEAGGPGPTGTVSSKPKGINCGSACDSAVASMYEGSAVLLTAKPSSGDAFVKWEGGDCEGIVATTCTVTMNQAEEVKAVFSGSTKPIVDPQALSVSKGESSGTGTVKAAGLACEAECSETTVLYQGPISLPKPKPGKTVELKETPAYGSSFTGWSGACSGSEPTCKVTMEEAEEVTAEFAAKPKTTLTIEKNSYETGDGTVSSKPKGINCATACTTQAMSVPSGEAIVLKEKPATGMTFAGWSGGGCSGTAETCTVSPSSATTVHATFSGTPKAIVNPQVLTLTKAGSGFGTVKAAGLACENECTSASVLFQGPIALPKPKPGKTVLLKATSAPGSKTVVWSGCDSEPTATECVVTMEEAKNVTATFDELE